MDLHSLPSDHIDLLMTAGCEFGVIAAPPGTPRPHQVATAVAQFLGTRLLSRNRCPGAGYLYRPIEGALDVRDILKAAHAAQFAYRDSRGWIGSPEQQAVDAVAKAAAMRVPGYELSPWVWTRPEFRAIGFAKGWRPVVKGIWWVDDVELLTEAWRAAHLVVLTRESLRDLPGLQARPRVYVVVEPAEAAEAIMEAEASPLEVESVLIWPEGMAWLSQQLVS